MLLWTCLICNGVQLGGWCSECPELSSSRVRLSHPEQAALRLGTFGDDTQNHPSSLEPFLTSVPGPRGASGGEGGSVHARRPWSAFPESGGLRNPDSRNGPMGQAQRCASRCLPSLCPGMAGPELPELCAPNSLGALAAERGSGSCLPAGFVYTQGPQCSLCTGHPDHTAKSEKVTAEQEKVFLNGNILNIPKYTILSILSVILGIPNL